MLPLPSHPGLDLDCDWDIQLWPYNNNTCINHHCKRPVIWGTHCVGFVHSTLTFCNSILNIEIWESILAQIFNSAPCISSSLLKYPCSWAGQVNEYWLGIWVICELHTVYCVAHIWLFKCFRHITGGGTFLFIYLRWLKFYACAKCFMYH